MYQFLLDLYRYCVKYKICFGDLDHNQQNIVIRKALKFTLNLYISKNQKRFIKGEIPFDVISKNYLSKKNI